jgi:hypothetical protein
MVEPGCVLIVLWKLLEKRGRGEVRLPRRGRKCRTILMIRHGVVGGKAMRAAPPLDRMIPGLMRVVEFSVKGRSPLAVKSHKVSVLGTLSNGTGTAERIALAIKGDPTDETHPWGGESVRAMP